VDRGNVGMIESGCSPSLLQKAAPVRGGGHVTGEHHLDRNRTMQTRVYCPKHSSHTARADQCF